MRCALEDDDSGDIRLDKLVQLIRESPRSIHDLSRVEPDRNELPRFNMPFELGLALGAKRFGQRLGDRIKIMVADPYRLPAYLSDLGGNDPSAHRTIPNRSFASSAAFCTAPLPAVSCLGPPKLRADFKKFKAQLPAIARQIHYQADESSGFGNYRTFVWCVAEILRRPSRADQD